MYPSNILIFIYKYIKITDIRVLIADSLYNHNLLSYNATNYFIYYLLFILAT